MVVETFVAGAGPVYARAAEVGRLLPDGLNYIDSWIDGRDLRRCFQLMETDDPSLLLEWTKQWSDLVDFEVVPVISSSEAASRVASTT
jgi:hypothetical protein